MRIQIEKGLTRKIAHVTGARASTDEEITAAALKAAGEDLSSLFGIRLVRYEDTATVTMHTD